MSAKIGNENLPKSGKAQIDIKICEMVLNSHHMNASAHRLAEALMMSQQDNNVRSAHRYRRSGSHLI
jgi:hypothetical protein